MQNWDKSPDLTSIRIREIIKKLGGLAKASSVCDISIAQLSQYQRGKNKAGHKNLSKLARAGGVTVDWILGLDQSASQLVHQSASLPIDQTERLADQQTDPKKARLLKEIQLLRKDLGELIEEEYDISEVEIALRHLKRQLVYLKAFVKRKTGTGRER